MFAASKTDSASTGDYQISRSLRFNSADSAYLSRTPASGGNQSTWTYSAWIKRSTLGVAQTLFQQQTTSSDTGYFGIIFFAGDTLGCSGWASTWRVTTQVFRDTSAWYHLVVAVDTTQATANNRIRVYINGSEITAFSTTNNPTQNSTTGINGTGPAAIGREYNGTLYYNGYQTETYMIDGSQLTPSSFGETDTQTGVWKPKAYSGSYGTNGFYLNFLDNSNTTAATLGKDYSGNGNNWTPNNFSVTAGAGNDSLVDSPTSYGTDTGVGGNVRGNYSTLNPLVALSGTRTFSNGNLNLAVATTNVNTFATFALPTSGKWYWEYQVTATAGIPMGGVLTGFISDIATGVVYLANGEKYVNNTNSAYGASYTTTDIIGVAVDVDGGTITFYKNNTSQGAITASVGGLFPIVRSNSTSDTFVFNFGQRPFAYTAPSGFKALCTQNLPTPTIGATTATQAGKFFNPVLYTGNGGTQSVTGVGFQPDFSWIKTRSGTNGHAFEDAVRGAGKTLFSNETGAEFNFDSYFTAFTSDGFNLALGGGSFNTSSGSYVAWNWKANGAGSTNTAGSITSTVSANTTSGFSIITWTGNATQGASIGHGLGAVPALFIIKNRSTAGTNWPVKTNQLSTNSYLYLNSNGASASFAFFWPNDPTSSVIYLGSNSEVNGSGNSMICYAFAPVAGYSAFGKYTGNGSADGPFVYCGFRPRYVMIKDTQNTWPWIIVDTARNTYNTMNAYLKPNSSDAEATNFANSAIIDVTANGFKTRTSDAYTNTNGSTMIFVAFAEAPFKYALAR